MAELAPPPALAKKAARQARTTLWRKGILSWKFKDRPWCREMYDWIRARWGLAGFLFALMHRRGGKSTTALIIGLEECLREKNITVGVVTGTREQAAAICDESLTEVLADCPKDLMPRLISNKWTYVFDHNGSKLVMLPADRTNWKKLRGRKFRLLIFTEACFIDDLDNIIRKTLPTLRDVLGKSNGTMLLESTPPDEPEHPSEKLWAEAELDGRAFFLPLSKNPHASPAFVAEAQKDSGGAGSVTYRREYELQFLYDDESTVLPEFTHDRAFVGDLEHGLPRIVREVARPSGADLYGALDVGGRDLSAALWGFYLFTENVLVIEDELALLNITSDELARRVKAKEKALWGEHPAGKLRRYADNNNVILLYDLLRLHQLRYTASAKDNRDAQINLLRVMIREGQLVIHPRCRLLIKTMRLARREKQKRKGFMRGEEIGHADLLEALLFLVRNVRRTEMPQFGQVPVAQAQQGIEAPVRYGGDDGLAKALGLGNRRRWGA